MSERDETIQVWRVRWSGGRAGGAEIFVVAESPTEAERRFHDAPQYRSSVVTSIELAGYALREQQ